MVHHDRYLRLTLILFVVVACGLLPLGSVLAQSKPTVMLPPSGGPRDALITVNGTGFVPGDAISIQIVGHLENGVLSTATAG